VSGEQFQVEDGSEGRPLPVTANGVTLWTESFGPGDGAPLLLVMGAMNQGLFWPRAFCEQLAEAGFLVIRYDHRDTGRSSIVDYRRHPYTLTEMTGDALAILNAYGCAAAAVVGMSMGGYIAQLLAVESPRRVSGLVLLSTTADHRPYMAATMGCDAGRSPLPPPSRSFIEYVESAGRRVQAGADDYLALTLEGWRVTHGGSLPFPEREMEATIRAAAAHTRDASAVYHHALAVAASPPRSDILHRIAAPTLVIHGAFDPCLPLPHGQHLAAGISNARLLVLDMGHMLPPPMAAEVGGAIVSFLRTGDAAASEGTSSAL
jgi:pimeloyl-ACP methyl ester carboxylesterase